MILLISRRHSQFLPDRNAAWAVFIRHIGGVDSLSFNLTRQSGNRWKIINITQGDRDRDELRKLIHCGVWMDVLIINRFLNISEVMFGFI